MQIKTAKYLISSPRVEQCPSSKLPEYAFIGRSNVGKSSLINMLTGYGKLAKTSATPGKTMLINHFLINDNWHLVDLPGYGYAKRGKQEQENFKVMISDYILKRPQLTNLFLLIDVRHKPMAIDLDFIEWLGENQVPFALIFTKSDKLSQSAVASHVQYYLKELQEQWEELPPYFVSSAVNQKGKDEILDYIEEINRSL